MLFEGTVSALAATNPEFRSYIENTRNSKLQGATHQMLLVSGSLKVPASGNTATGTRCCSFGFASGSEGMLHPPEAGSTSAHRE
jgi:hypothetical protein